jgi:hypothetical protein
MNKVRETTKTLVLAESQRNKASTVTLSVAIVQIFSQGLLDSKKLQKNINTQRKKDWQNGSSGTALA